MAPLHPLPHRPSGLTAVELLFVLALFVTVAAIAVPLTGEALDHLRTGMAARYLAAQIMDARLQAIRRSAAVGLRFEPMGDDYRFTAHVDGNANGIRSADITAGVDPLLGLPPQTLAVQFRGVRFGLAGGIPDVDGGRSPSAGDGVRIGTSRILTLSPDGTATSGTLYVRGQRAQFAVRILGVTGRTRVLRFDPGGQQWVKH